jgi:hypothetical protein
VHKGTRSAPQHPQDEILALSGWMYNMINPIWSRPKCVFALHKTVFGHRTRGVAIRPKKLAFSGREGTLQRIQVALYNYVVNSGTCLAFPDTRDYRSLLSDQTQAHRRQAARSEVLTGRLSPVDSRARLGGQVVLTAGPGDT